MKQHLHSSSLAADKATALSLVPVSPETEERLDRFVALPPSPLEKREKLEQLRALEAGMRIDVALVDTAPLGVDAAEDLERARLMLAPGKHG